MIFVIINVTGKYQAESVREPRKTSSLLSGDMELKRCSSLARYDRNVNLQRIVWRNENRWTPHSWVDWGRFVIRPLDLKKITQEENFEGYQYSGGVQSISLR